MKRFWIALALTWITAITAIVVLLAIPKQLPRFDTAALNDLTQSVAAQWPVADQLPATDLSYTVASLDGTVLASQGEPITSALDAAQKRAVSAPVVVDGTVVGFVYMADPAADAWLDLDRRTTAVAIAVIITIAMIATVLLLYLLVRVGMPFKRLNEFASRVASGDLAAPLAMDRANIFGAFSESFDLMRNELADARAQEAEAKASKERLVAQIGHDIRTPVASITAASELLSATVRDQSAIARLETINAKAHQIDRLLSDLFHANRTELAALTVTLQEIPSDELSPMLRHADFDEKARIDPPPPCIVVVDPLRMQQVIDNIIVNSYKYAGTPIEVSWSFLTDVLVARIKDFGPGVPEHDLQLIFGPGFRGSNVGDVPGSGLGLYTSSYLMEQMGGAVVAHPVPDGFAVEVQIRLAGELGIR